MGILVQTFKIGRRQLIGTTTTAAFNCDVFLKRNIVRQSTNLAKLTEVGRLESPKLDSRYETGQLFLHRIFGYRGVILFPWTARVYDRDLQNPSKKVPVQSKIFKVDATIAAEKTHATQHGSGIGKAKTSDGSSKQESTVGTPAAGTAAVPQTEPSPVTAGKAAVPPPPPPSATSENATKEIKGKVHTYYQVLIDSRDCPYIRAQTEAVTFLGNQDSNRSLYAIPGLDYVAHDDIMPYSSAEKHPLHHELFDKFLTHAPGKDPPFKGQETLKAWQEKNHPWLELSDVHKETTEGIRVTVIPFYMGCRETPASSVYWWRYCIRLENLGELSVQLRERHWRIFSLSGTLETVRGRGVVGQEPILSQRLPAFQYSSHVSLQAPSGHMWGTFRLEREDGHTFDCKIPPFSLESKPEDATPSSTTDTSGGSSATGNKRDDNE